LLAETTPTESLRTQTDSPELTLDRVAGVE
jgi:hypothetical protein